MVMSICPSVSRRTSSFIPSLSISFSTFAVTDISPFVIVRPSVFIVARRSLSLSISIRSEDEFVFIVSPAADALSHSSSDFSALRTFFVGSLTVTVIAKALSSSITFSLFSPLSSEFMTSSVMKIVPLFIVAVSFR